MRLLLLSGLSGSGKTVALHTLEDAGFFCIDNLPLALLDALIDDLNQHPQRRDERVAVGVDVRSGQTALAQFPEALAILRQRVAQVEVIFLDADEATLLQRYHHTRRRHPLARQGIPLVEAIRMERHWLARLAAHADLRIDSSDLTMHGLARLIRDRLTQPSEASLSLLFQSFGFKYGAPVDADFVFDVRCLPNPHYEPGLRHRTGLEQPVIDFLQAHSDVEDMYQGIHNHLQRWVPQFARDHRSYLTIALGCTGGHHRSVYLAERLAQAWRRQHPYTVSIRHRELDPSLDAE